MAPRDPNFPDPSGSSPHPSRDSSPVAGRIDPGAWASLDTTPPPALQSAPDVRSLLQALKRRWITAACLSITLGGIAAVAAWVLLSPQYTAEAKIQIKYDIATIMPSAGGIGGHTDFVTYLRTQAAKILSSPVINKALKEDDIKRVNLFARQKDPAVWVLEHLKIDVQEKSEIVGVSIATNDPDLSVAVVKAMTQAYMDVCVYADEQIATDRVAKVQHAYDDADRELKHSREALEAFRKGNKIPPPNVATQIMAELQNQLMLDTNTASQLRLEITRTSSQLNVLDMQIEALKDPKAMTGDLETALATDADYNAMEKSLSSYQRIIADYEQKAPGVAFPLRMQTETQAEALRSALQARRKKIADRVARQARNAATASAGASGRDGLRINRAQMAENIASMKKLSEVLDKEMKSLAEQLAQMKMDVPDQEALYEKIKNQQKTVDTLHETLQKAKVDLQADKRISIFQNAELQKKDVKKQIAGVVGAPLGMLLAVCAGLSWMEYRLRRIRSASEVSRGLGIRVVGAVPNVPDLERHLIGPDGEPDLEGHPVLESFDAIRTLLLRNGQANRIVMVTSAAASEGKTTLACHLAGSMARAGRRTLLIDGDLRSPAAHQLFELPMQPGFSEVILAEVELADAIQPTALDGLSFIAAGQWDREVLYALARDGLEALFEKLLQEFDCIVIDSHPVLSATDSLLIGQQVDSVILSVRREVSQMPRVYAASQRMTSLGIRVLGAVVNGSDPEEALAMAAPARASAA